MLKSTNISVRVLLLRHGETDWNREQRFQGQKDVPLNANGIRQAEAVQDFLQPLTIDHAYTSSLKRAKQTATLILKGRAVTLEIKDEFKEVNHGDWVGMLESDVKQLYPEQFTLWHTNPSLATKPNGETLEEVSKRVIPAWEKLISNCADTSPKTVLIVAHKLINQLILCHVCGLSLDHFWEFPQQNCSINIIDYPQGCQNAACLQATNLSPEWASSVKV